MKDKFITVRIEEDEKKFLSNHAKKNCRKLVDTIRLAIKEWISHEKRKELKKQ